MNTLFPPFRNSPQRLPSHLKKIFSRSFTLFGVLFGVVLSVGYLAPTQAHGQSRSLVSKTPPAQGAELEYGFSPLELRVVRKLSAKHRLTLLRPEEAEGKRIEDIVIDTVDVFTPEDIWPDVLNVLHVTSKNDVIKRELLLQEGETYKHSIVSETARNLRNLGVISIALVLPVKGSTPDSVKLLVITRDTWSLRTNVSFLFVGDTLNFLSLSLSESNLFGRHKRVGITSFIEQDTITFGQKISDPRVWGTRLFLQEEFNVIYNRDTFDWEGVSGALSIGSPLYSLRTPWAWYLTTSGLTDIGRFFVGDQVRTYDNPDTPQQEEIPFIWRNKFISVDTRVTRSYGVRVKQNISAGYEWTADEYRFGASNAIRDETAREDVDAFERNILPRSEVTSGPYLQYRVFLADFLPLRNVNSFALPEDFRFGPSLQARVRHSVKAFGSSSRFQEAETSFVHRWFLGDRNDEPSQNGDIISLRFGAETRHQDREWVDNQLLASIQNYSPVFFHGRLVSRVGGAWRIDDRQNRQATLGGESGLRGYEAGFFLGTSKLTWNTEWRTMAYEIFNTFHLGLVGFYDVGAITRQDDFSNIEVYHSAGMGFRFLNPSSNRVVFRADWGVPLNPPAGLASLPGKLTAGFEQAF